MPRASIALVGDGLDMSRVHRLVGSRASSAQACLADRTSFTRFRVLRSPGTWYGEDPAERSCALIR